MSIDIIRAADSVALPIDAEHLHAKFVGKLYDAAAMAACPAVFPIIREVSLTLELGEVATRRVRRWTVGRRAHRHGYSRLDDVRRGPAVGVDEEAWSGARLGHRRRIEHHLAGAVRQSDDEKRECQGGAESALVRAHDC
jgi:hypothetical protein